MNKKLEDVYKKLGFFIGFIVGISMVVHYVFPTLHIYIKEGFEITYYILGGIGIFMLGIKDMYLKTEKIVDLHFNIPSINYVENSNNIYLEIYNHGNDLADNIYVNISEHIVCLEKHSFKSSLLNTNLGFIKSKVSVKIPLGCKGQNYIYILGNQFTENEFREFLKLNNGNFPIKYKYNDLNYKYINIPISHLIDTKIYTYKKK